MKRIGSAVLRTVAAEAVTFRVLLDQDTTSDALQLGLTAAPTEDVELKPVAVRERAGGFEVLVSDEVLRKSGVPDAREWLEGAVGAIVCGRLLRVQSVRQESGVWVVALMNG
jgi:hypothetical protein